ncbi:MAG: hypothetical protein IKQ00_06410 [Butyrivibrio sp.]|nr:hypothetical protein [Butyrivibrio sp.]MBR4640998.1 hypothetical protein [Butyrivibrio sp.]
MSEKMSVNIEVLGINTSHNYLVPNDMGISKIILLVIQTLKEEYPEAQCDSQTGHMLIQESTGRALVQNCSLKQLGIVNGEKLLLV